MFVDERIYTLHAGKVPVFLSLYEKEGMSVQSRILGRMVGYYFTEFGTLNQIVHQWAYVSMEDRLARRKLLLASQEWQNYAKKMQPLVAHVENKMLMPAPFFIEMLQKQATMAFTASGQAGRVADSLT